MAAVFGIAAALEFQRFCSPISPVEIEEEIAGPMPPATAYDVLADCSLAYQTFRLACLMSLDFES